MCSAVLLQTVCARVCVCCRGYILDLMEGGRKLIVFAHHKSVLDSISECLLNKVYSTYYSSVFGLHLCHIVCICDTCVLHLVL